MDAFFWKLPVHALRQPAVKGLVVCDATVTLADTEGLDVGAEICCAESPWEAGSAKPKAASFEGSKDTWKFSVSLPHKCPRIF